jgi:hypothetical protein
VGRAREAHPRIAGTLGNGGTRIAGEQEQLWPHTALCCLRQDARPVAVEGLLEREADQPCACPRPASPGAGYYGGEQSVRFAEQLVTSPVVILLT